MLRYLLKVIKRTVLILFNCGLKAWFDNFLGCCGRMYTEFFFLLVFVSSPLFFKPNESIIEEVGFKI